MMQEIFNQVEELTGTYPTGDNLRSAVHAIITKGMHVDARSRDGYAATMSYMILNNVDYIARTYESARGTTQVIGGTK